MRSLFLTNWYSIFYWLSVADNAKVFFTVMVIVFTTICVIATVVFIFARQDFDGYGNTKPLSAPTGGTAERAKKWMWWGYPFMILFWSLFVLTPSRMDTLLIITGGAIGTFVTTDSSARQIPPDLTRFVHLQLLKKTEDLSDDAKQVLGLPQKSAKERIIDKIKSVSSDEAIKYIQSLNDSTLGK